MPSPSPSLSPAPAPAPMDARATGGKSAPINLASSPPASVPQSRGSRKKRAASELTEPDADANTDIVPEDPAEVRRRADEAKARHRVDLAKHAYEPPKAERPQDDWQVAYVWAFIVKFGQREKIRKLECLEDFERALVEPIPNRPDDILEGILVRFLQNLKPGSRNIDCTSVQGQLSAYITDHLTHSTEFTVWDRPWAPQEEARGGCCSTASDRQELGRLRYAGEPISERVDKNPLKQIEERGGGLFELDWRERARILRQLVDWQLTDSEPIKAIINSQKGLAFAKNIKIPENLDKVAIEPLGMDRDKNRLWAFDNSGRLWKSGNPFRRPCPIYAVSSNHRELTERVDTWRAHGESSAPVLTKVSRKTMSKDEITAAKKASKGIESERELAEKAAGMLEGVEKEEQRIIRARKRYAEQSRFTQQAEFRSTRTRRTTRKIDYAYDGLGDDDDDDDDEDEAPRRGRGSAAYEPQAGRTVIPGERKSARQAAKEEAELAAAAAVAASRRSARANGNGNGHGNGNGYGNGNGSEGGGAHADSSSEPSSPPMAPEDGAGVDRSSDNEVIEVEVEDEVDVDVEENGKARARPKHKGYAWVEEVVSVQQLSEGERAVYEREQKRRREEKEKEKEAAAAAAAMAAEGGQGAQGAVKSEGNGGVHVVKPEPAGGNANGGNGGLGESAIANAGSGSGSEPGGGIKAEAEPNNQGVKDEMEVDS